MQIFNNAMEDVSRSFRNYLLQYQIHFFGAHMISARLEGPTREQKQQLIILTV